MDDPLQFTIRLPSDHPAAPELRELMNMLATEVHVGEQVARRPGFEGGTDVMLDALCRAGFSDQVNKAVRRIMAAEEEWKREHPEIGGDVTMSIMNAMLQSHIANAPKHIQEQVGELVQKTVEGVRRG